MKNAVITYLGGLKSGKKGEKFTDLKIRKPIGEVMNVFTRPIMINKASNYILYSAPMAFTTQNRVVMNAIGSVLNMRYLESIREKEVVRMELGYVVRW